MHERMQSVCKKNKSLSCFSCFCACACFVGHNMHTRHGKRGAKSWNTKLHIIDISVMTMSFCITFGSSFAKQSRCCLVFCNFLLVLQFITCVKAKNFHCEIKIVNLFGTTSVGSEEVFWLLHSTLRVFVTALANCAHWGVWRLLFLFWSACTPC